MQVKAWVMLLYLINNIIILQNAICAIYSNACLNISSMLFIYSYFLCLIYIYNQVELNTIWRKKEKQRKLIALI